MPTKNGLKRKITVGNEQKRLRKRKAWLYRKNPYCPLCARRMILATPSNGILPNNAATIDHRDSRWSTERGNHQGEERTRLLCYRCNHLRGAYEEATQPISAHWARSTRSMTLVQKLRGWIMHRVKRRLLRRKAIKLWGKEIFTRDIQS